MVKTWALVAAVRAPVDVSGTAAAGLNGSFLSFHFWSLSSHIPIIPGALSYLWEQSARLLAHNPTRPEHNEEIKHTEDISWITWIITNAIKRIRVEWKF